MEACVVLVSFKEFKDGHEEDQPLECELRGNDLIGQAYKKVRVVGRKSSWALRNNLKSGESLIFAAGAKINYDQGELLIPSGATIQVRYALLRHLHLISLGWD